VAREVRGGRRDLVERQMAPPTKDALAPQCLVALVAPAAPAAVNTPAACSLLRWACSMLLAGCAVLGLGLSLSFMRVWERARGWR
jgi:hypothetical protein